MKIKIKILPLFLSIIIFISYFFNCSLLVRAESAWDKLDRWLGEHNIVKYFDLIPFAATQIGAVVYDKDFEKFISNQDAFYEFWNRDSVCPITIDEESETITFSKDLVAYIKQALKEYAEETCGFIVYPTIDINTQNVTIFSNLYQYETAKAIVKKYGMASVQIYSARYLRLDDLSLYLDGNAGFYISNSGISSYYVVDYMDMRTWEKIYDNDTYLLHRDELDITLSSWEEIEDFVESNEQSEKSQSKLIKNSRYGVTKEGYGFMINKGYPEIISRDGRRMLLFKSQEALINYSADHRTVYFGSKFYEDSGSVTGSLDDLQDWLDGKYDDFFDRLKDTIGDSNLTEDELEKIVDGIIDKLGDIEKNTQETNEWLEMIYNALLDLDDTVAEAFSSLEFSFDTSGIEEYLAYILDDLDYIVYRLEDMTVEEAEEKTDSLFSSLISAFSEIADVAKNKFPLSIPWDIYYMLTMFGGISESPAAYESVNAVYSSSEGIMLISDGGKVATFSANPVSTYDILTVPAPRFELPLIIDSWGINESIIVDLSGFEVISQMSRSMFTCVFVVGLINLTFNVIEFGKEFFGD